MQRGASFFISFAGTHSNRILSLEVSPNTHNVERVCVCMDREYNNCECVCIMACKRTLEERERALFTCTIAAFSVNSK